MEAPKNTPEWPQVQRFLLRHLLPYFLLVVLICFGLDWGFRNYVIYKTPMHGAAKLHRVMQDHGDEIPIFGSSRALGSYIPDSLSPQVYNYGINGIGYEVVELFLRYETEKPGKTSPIIINFDYNLFRGGIGDRDNYIPHVHRPEIQDLLKSRDAWEHWYLLPGIRFFNSYDSYTKDFINERIGLTKFVNRGASIEKNVIPQAEFDRKVAERLKKPEKWVIDPAQEARFKGYFEQTPDRKFYLVVAPYHRSYHESFKGMVEAKAWLRKMDALANVEVISVDGQNWDDSLFVNTTHINYQGALRFSAQVRDQIFGNKP